jgi:hypothetical protein
LKTPSGAVHATANTGSPGVGTDDGSLCAALTDQVGQRVLIRNGLIVPAGKMLLIYDVSVDFIASEVFGPAGVPQDRCRGDRLSQDPVSNRGL